MRYIVEFTAKVEIEAETQEEAIRKAWLNENLFDARYRLISVKEKVKK